MPPGPMLHARRVDLRLVDARAVDARDPVGGGRRPNALLRRGRGAFSSTSAVVGSAASALVGLLAGQGVDLEKRFSVARPIQICFGGLTCICDVDRLARAGSRAAGG